MIHNYEHSIRDNYLSILDRINQAAVRSGRASDTIKLVVVTKGHTIKEIEAAVEVGLRDFGENYVEEASEKIKYFSETPDIKWHMIGHIQSRKASLVTELFDYAHAVDSLKLARRLSRFSVNIGRILPVLLECNVSGEETKFGYQASNDQDWEKLVPEIAEILALPNLKIEGLMTMAPYFEDQERAKPIFRRLKTLQSYLNKRLPEANLNQLSMGMSGDFEAAIQEGSTCVRIGTAIMGPRTLV